jgi:hypothetical protein
VPPVAEQITTLDGIRGGRFVVTTIHGTTHTIDLDKKTLVRKAGNVEREWNDEAGIGLGRITPDGETFYFDLLMNATVGHTMVVENKDEWRMTSQVVSIERA